MMGNHHVSPPFVRNMYFILSNHLLQANLRDPIYNFRWQLIVDHTFAKSKFFPFSNKASYFCHFPSKTCKPIGSLRSLTHGERQLSVSWVLADQSMDATVFFPGLTSYQLCRRWGTCSENAPNRRTQQYSLGRGLKHVFIFNPIPWGNDPTWGVYFWNGLKPSTNIN